MTHGTGQAILGLGDENDSNSLNSLGATQTELTDHTGDATAAHAASAVSVADAGLYTATTEVEAALQEVYSRLPKGDTLAADFTAASDATPNATTLLVPLVASKVYAFELTAVISSTVNGGVRLSFSFPAGTTMEFTSVLFEADSTVLLQPGGDQTNEVNYLKALSEDLLLIKGRVNVSATAGNLTVNFAQDTSHIDTSTLHAESTLTIIPVS